MRVALGYLALGIYTGLKRPQERKPEGSAAFLWGFGTLQFFGGESVDFVYIFACTSGFRSGEVRHLKY